MPTQRSAPLVARIGAFFYESVLVFGISFFVSALIHTLVPAADDNPWVLRIALFFTLGVYFSYCWQRSGQTLAMKAWHIRLVGQTSDTVPWMSAILRYCAAWTMVIPGLILVWMMAAQGLSAMLLWAIGCIAMLLPAFFTRQGRLLHDWIAGTQMESTQ